MPGTTEETRIVSTPSTTAAWQFAGPATMLAIEGAGHSMAMNGSGCECRNCNAVLASDDAEKYDTEYRVSILGSLAEPCPPVRPEQYKAVTTLLDNDWKLSNVYSDGIIRLCITVDGDREYGVFVHKDGFATRPQDMRSYILQSDMHSMGVKVRG